MNRIVMVAGVTLVGLLAGTAGAVASSNDGRPGLFQKVNSIGWGARVTRDRDPYIEGYEGYGPVEAPGFGSYDDEPAPVYRRAYRPVAPVVPYGAGPYGYDPYED